MAWKSIKSKAKRGRRSGIVLGNFIFPILSKNTHTIIFRLCLYFQHFAAVPHIYTLSKSELPDTIQIWCVCIVARAMLSKSAKSRRSIYIVQWKQGLRDVGRFHLLAVLCTAPTRFPDDLHSTPSFDFAFFAFEINLPMRLHANPTHFH